MTNIQERFELLTLNKQFIKEVKNLRKKWKIPSKGLEDKDMKEWIAIPFNLDELNDYQMSQLEGLGSEMFKSMLLGQDAKKLCEKYGYHGYYWAFRDYILFNIPVNERKQFAITHGPDNFGKKGLFLEILPETQLSDIKDFWKGIEITKKRFFKENKSIKNRPLKNFQRDKRVFILSQEGKKDSEITAIINKEFGCNLSYKDVGMIKLRMNKKVYHK